jgi:hypothetical protein
MDLGPVAHGGGQHWWWRGRKSFCAWWRMVCLHGARMGKYVLGLGPDADAMLRGGRQWLYYVPRATTQQGADVQAMHQLQQMQPQQMQQQQQQQQQAPNYGAPLGQAPAGLVVSAAANRQNRQNPSPSMEKPGLLPPSLSYRDRPCRAPLQRAVPSRLPSHCTDLSHFSAFLGQSPALSTSTA